MDEVNTQDILVVLIQKEKMITAMSRQITALMQENQSLIKRLEAQSGESAQ